MKLVNGRMQMEPGERALVVEDHGFMSGIHAVIVYRHQRFRVYGHPTAASVARIRRWMKASGGFARLRGTGPVGPKGAAPYPRDYWVCPGPPWLLGATPGKDGDDV